MTERTLLCVVLPIAEAGTVTIGANSKWRMPEYLTMPLSSTATHADHADAVAHREIASKDGFERAYDDNALSVFRYAASRVGVEVAEDVTAEVFAVAWRGRHNYSPDAGSTQAWMLGVATRVIARHRESEQRWLRHTKEAGRLGIDLSSYDDLGDINYRLDATHQRTRVYAAIARLPQRDREAFLLHVITGASYEEIATALSVPIGTVRSRINRARTRLQKRLAKDAD